MKKLFLYLAIALLLSACSFKTHPNEWQYKSVNAFDSYTKNFLSSNDAMAKNDLNRAINHAKKGADINVLARIYLAECALNISVGQTTTCQPYKDIEDLINDKSLHAYYKLLTASVTQEQIDFLANNYQSFSRHVNRSEFSKANEDILKMNNPTSKFLAAALIKDNIENNTLDELIKIASFNGYKKVVLYWLDVKLGLTQIKFEQEKLIKKIFIFESAD